MFFSKKGRPLVRSNDERKVTPLILSTPSGNRTGRCGGGGGNDCGRAWDF